DGLDRRLVDRPAGKGAVQVHEVQASRPGVDPASRDRGGVVTEGGGRVHVALLEADALAVFQVNRGDQQHGRWKVRWRKGARERRCMSGYGVQCRKLRYSARPWSALFSGWNWVAKMLSRASAQVKRSPYSVSPTL